MFPSSYFLIFMTLFSATMVCSSVGPTTPISEGAAEETIEWSIRFLYLAYDEIQAREIQTRKDPVVHDKYNQCGVLYTRAVNGLINVMDLLKSGDYHKLPSLASIALQQVEDCDNIFTPPGTETGFKNLSDKAVAVCTNVVSLVKGFASQLL